MQKEYKEAMEKISLSDSDKERILANVKKAYEESADTVVPMDTGQRCRPRFSARQIGAAAAAVLVLLAGTWVVSRQFFVNRGENNPGDQVIVAGEEEEIWEELDSVDAIAAETDCRTYTLSNVSKNYKVKKVEVAKKQKHVKITYKNEKEKDKILLEYKEEENESAVIGQFDERKELAKEKVEDSEVTLYGDEKCDGMTWQQESCTFAVKMSKARSIDKAKDLVSGTRERVQKDTDTKTEQEIKEKKVSRNAVGWEGNEEQSSDRERRSVWKKIFDLYGFRVTIEDPAKKAVYKIVDDFESFSFIYPEIEELASQRIVGYAGLEGCPAGVLNGFEEDESYQVNGIRVRSYRNDEGEWLFYFVKQEISFTLLVKEWSGEDTSHMLSGLLSVIRISLDDGQSDDGEGEDPQSQDNGDGDDGGADSQEPDSSDAYRETVEDIQYAVAEGSMKKLSSYMRFPLTIHGLGITVNNAREFQALHASWIFSSAWVDAVVSYDGSKIQSNTKTIIMGDSTHSLTCEIKNNSVVITELHVEGRVTEPTATPNSTSMNPE